MAQQLARQRITMHYALLHTQLVHYKLKNKSPIVNRLLCTLARAMTALEIHVENNRTNLTGIALQRGHKLFGIHGVNSAIVSTRCYQHSWDVYP